jgi:repressor of nif and glnA expression
LLMIPTTNQEHIERKILLILRILHEAQQALGARIIARRMKESGVMMSERTVRYHLKLMDEKGLTELLGHRDGRVITPLGAEELDNARVQDKIGFAISRIENLAFRTTFQPKSRKGLLPVNVSLIPKEHLPDTLAAMKPAFDDGLHVSDLVALAEGGHRLGDVLIPEGKVGFATVCSVVINGVLLKSGVPMDSKFGGILQMKKGSPLRFVEVIYYSGSSLDPSEVFIRGKMTSVRTVVERGEGKILANFREIPAPSRAMVVKTLAHLKNAGFGGVLTMGEIGEPICQTPVELNKIGMVLLGGLNPAACAQEAGIELDNRAMSTLMPYEELKPFREYSGALKRRKRR